MGTELFHALGWTDREMTKPIVAFRNFANAPTSVCSTRHEITGSIRVLPHAIFTSGLSTSHPGRLTLEYRNPNIHCMLNR